jgi:hypothetical protein
MGDDRAVSKYWRTMSAFFILIGDKVSMSTLQEKGLSHALLEAASRKYGKDGESVASEYRRRNHVEQGRGYPIEFEG